MLTTLDSLKATADELLKETFASLTEQQQLIFRQIDSLLADVKLTAEELLEKSTQLAEISHQGRDAPAAQN